jgi:hypothetical protein
MCHTKVWHIFMRINISNCPFLCSCRLFKGHKQCIKRRAITFLVRFVLFCFSLKQYYFL